MLDRQLNRLGFTARETKVFLSLVEIGQANANKLSRRTGIRRTTVYSVLTSLTQKGVVSQQQGKDGTVFTVNRPASLMRIVQRERDELDEKEQVTRSLIEALSEVFQSAEHTIPKIHFFEGKKNVENMLFDTYDARQQSLTKTETGLWGYQDGSYFTEYKKYSEYYFTNRKKQGTTSLIRLFADEARFENTISKRYTVVNREVRPFPPELELTSTLWVQGDFITMIQSRDLPHYAIQIKDSWIASNLRKVFQFLWYMTGPGPKNYPKGD